MFQNGLNGFCMALADSVPGLSGGTVAFIMGFYDHLIGSIHSLVFGKMKEKKAAAIYLINLGFGWLMGITIAVMFLSALLESHIYLASSLFWGFILGAIPLIVQEEWSSLRNAPASCIFCLLGIISVVVITAVNSQTGYSPIDFGFLTFSTATRLFLIGMMAISAMFLPGLSGSTLLLIFGAYVPVITMVKGILSLDFSYMPGLLFFGCGVLVGIITVVKALKACLKKFRPQTIYLILGMMLGSLYAISMGPTTLAIPQAPLTLENFHFIAAAFGATLVFGMQYLKRKNL